MENIADNLAPTSPLSQYFNSSVMSVSVLGVIELETPFNPSEANSFLTHVLLPANPRFSSIMVKKKYGDRKWKMVAVNPEDHIHNPVFPVETESYQSYFDEYLTKISVQPFSQHIPMWELHIFNYPTANAASNIIFKIHHSISDGFSLMTLLLSCLKRADDPSLPLTFPSRQRSQPQPQNHNNNVAKSSGVFSRMPRFVSSVCNTISNFGWSIMKSTLVEDDLTPIKSDGDCMELVKPIAISNLTFSLDQIKQIKTKLKATVNEVLTGIIFLGIRLYMQDVSYESSKANSSALILLNTRKGKAYKSVQETMKSDSDVPWGNHIAFLPVPILKLMNNSTNPLDFVKEAKEMIMLQRNPIFVFVTSKMFEMVKHLTGSEIGARLFKRKLKNASIMISNMMGPIEKMALANHAVKGLYFTVPGVPHSLMITIVSYMGDLRIVFGAEQCFIDQAKLKFYMEEAFKEIFNSAYQVSAM